MFKMFEIIFVEFGMFKIFEMFGKMFEMFKLFEIMFEIRFAVF